PYKILTDIIDSGLYHPSLRSGLISRNNRESLENDPEYQRIITERPKLAKDSLMATFSEYELDALVYQTSNALPAVVGSGQGAGNANRLGPFSGFPAISVPAGFSENGLPVGMEMLGKEFDESTLIKLAYSYQEGTQHRKAPELE
ncbi:amidase family protein, partial [Neobacillus drentensis]|uniref:amidase family protein n=1 Tax=Neobacillus drentensis TaxID=220684 RepID=UPI002FFEF8A9